MSDKTHIIWILGNDIHPSPSTNSKTIHCADLTCKHSSSTICQNGDLALPSEIPDDSIARCACLSKNICNILFLKKALQCSRAWQAVDGVGSNRDNVISNLGAVAIQTNHHRLMGVALALVCHAWQASGWGSNTWQGEHRKLQQDGWWWVGKSW